VAEHEPRRNTDAVAVSPGDEKDAHQDIALAFPEWDLLPPTEMLQRHGRR
jgi:hypothetical protein